MTLDSIQNQSNNFDTHYNAGKTYSPTRVHVQFCYTRQPQKALTYQIENQKIHGYLLQTARIMLLVSQPLIHIRKIFSVLNF